MIEKKEKKGFRDLNKYDKFDDMLRESLKDARKRHKVIFRK